MFEEASEEELRKRLSSLKKSPLEQRNPQNEQARGHPIRPWCAVLGTKLIPKEPSYRLMRLRLVFAGSCLRLRLNYGRSEELPPQILFSTTSGALSAYCSRLPNRSWTLKQIPSFVTNGLQIK